MRIHGNVPRRAVRWSSVLIAIELVAGLPSSVRAQTTSERSPTLAAGVSAGALRFRDGSTEEVLSATVEIRARPWLSFFASPGVGRTSFGGASVSGLTDIPLTVRVMSDSFP